LFNQAVPFTTLGQKYEQWKNNQGSFQPEFIQLSDLGSYPKDFPDPSKPFLLKEEQLKIFSIFDDFDSELQNPKGDKSYGWYLTGPYGVGKSVVLYTVACIAIAKKWIVIYMPRCDEWATIANKRAQLRYILEYFYRYVQFC
jgi:hypothetical protein